MATKFYTFIILFTIVISTTFSTCKKGGDIGCANTIYNFQIGMMAYPDIDNIHIGDTIWFDLNVPTNFIDITSNTNIEYSGAKNLGTAMGFANYSILNNPIPAANSFSTILLEGTKVDNANTNQIREYLFKEENNRYLFKLAIIAKETGIFGIGPSSAQNVYRASDNCTKAFFNIILQNTHHHYYLNPNINSSNSDTTQPSGSYYFRVN
jgi:hypothetical protein